VVLLESCLAGAPVTARGVLTPKVQRRPEARPGSGTEVRSGKRRWDADAGAAGSKGEPGAKRT
jgi:hypothetical protein